MAFLSANDVALINSAFDGNLPEVRDQLRAAGRANVNAQRESDGATALLAASYKGHVDIVRELLKHGNVDVNVKSNYRSANMDNYIRRGHFKNVRWWLDSARKKNVDSLYPGRMTALIMASYQGHIDIVRLLLRDKDVDANAQDDADGASALMAASYQGHEEIVLALLKNKKKVDINARDVYAETALYKASSQGHTKVVRVLLQHDDNLDANLKDADGKTALVAASNKGHVEIVRDLLKHNNVDVNARTKNGSTAVIEATSLGRAEILRELFQRHNVDVNVQDADGRTALIKASSYGNVEIVRILIQHKNVKVNVAMNDGSTALIKASRGGHLEVVDELLQHEDVDVNAQDTATGATALTIASCFNHVEVVRALLQHKSVKANVQTNDGTTALHMASTSGHAEVVRALLEHKDVDVNAHRTADSATSLHIASENCDVEVVRALLEHSKVDVNAKMQYGNTALIIASDKGHAKLVRALLQHPQIDVHAQCSRGAALHVATSAGHVKVVRELLKHNGLDVNSVESDRFTALRMASYHGHLEIVRLLIHHPDIEVNAKGPGGETALVVASEEGHEEIVRLLLQQDNVDANAQRESDGATALLAASCNGHVEVVSVMLQHKEVDTYIQGDDGKTAFDVAREKRHANILRLLEKHVQEEEENLSSLDTVMTTSTEEPVDLSFQFQFIKRCITNRRLGSGAFGEVFLAEHSRLPKKFAVKIIKLPQRSDCLDDEKLETLQVELSVRSVFCIEPLPCVEQSIRLISRSSSHKNARFCQTLKRLRHPNIIVLYGCSLYVEPEFLVLEYAANGSLDRFLKDDDMRDRLSASTRLSIMYQVARAIHCLHTGAAGFTVFHRDIKSSNICLTEDFTPRLNGCGMAKFVEDEDNNSFPSTTIEITGSSQGVASGTPGYMCPEYAWKKFSSIQCDYIPAYDVYSFGVVMAELTLGRLNDGKPTNVLQTYVMNGETPIVDGWKKLKDNADKKVTWNAEALEVVCMTVIRCITPSSERRLSTINLLDLLKHAIDIQAGKSNVGLEGERVGPPAMERLGTDGAEGRLTRILSNIG
jgi:ankyrin repeat protein/serine/threonine protein kinase